MCRTGRKSLARPIVALTATVISTAWILYAEIPPRVSGILQDRLTLTPAELATIDRRRAVAKSLRIHDSREIAAAGAVRVDVPIEFFLKQFVDIVSFKRSPLVHQIGKFGETARLEDIQQLTFDSGDIDELKQCRVADCGIQLSADQIHRLHKSVDWSKPDARTRANQVLREMLVDYVGRYRREGNKALIEYANEKSPLKLEGEVKLLVDHSAGILAGLREFASALAPGTGLEGAGEFIYWSKEQFGLKPVVSITHVLMYQPRRLDVPDVVIASKQIYASRYLGGSLAITLGARPSAAAPPSFYMAYVNRSRPRGFPPVIGGLVRRVAQGQMRDGLEEQLAVTKDRLEREFAKPARN
jgi:hypothetical protein